MPNIIIETSRDDLITKPDQLLARINEYLWQSGQFAHPTDIKSRIYSPSNAMIGLASESGNDFIFVRLYLMPGRDDTTLQRLVQTIADAIAAHIETFEDKTSFQQLHVGINPIVLSQNYLKTVMTFS